jgi:hypothetical protein
MIVLLASALDTLTYNASEIAKWQSDSRYNYNREFLHDDRSLWQIIQTWIYDRLYELFGRDADVHQISIWLTVIFVLIIIAVVSFLIYRHHGLFKRSQKIDSDAYTIEDETIYGINFDEETKEALLRNDFREAVRLIYMQTLKTLSDENLILWELYKTPRQYTMEFHHESFNKLTREYVKIRYGNFIASMTSVDTMRQWQHEICHPIKEGGSV